MLPWPELEGAAVEGKTGFLVFRRKDGEPVRWFAGESAKDLVVRVEDAKRKALHGLLKVDG